MIREINEKQPFECANISEVRNEIDNIDKEIIRLLSIRLSYVKEVVKYKDGTPEGIEASERKAEVLRTRGQWAEEQGLNAEVVEGFYDNLVKYFIEEEKKYKKI